jgi:predicted nucleotidyltransferase
VLGLVARNESNRASDIDILIELEPEASIGIFEYVGITQYLEDLFPNHVDMANRGSLKALLPPRVEWDAMYAFRHTRCPTASALLVTWPSTVRAPRGFGERGASVSFSGCVGQNHMLARNEMWSP